MYAYAPCHMLRAAVHATASRESRRERQRAIAKRGGRGRGLPTENADFDATIENIATTWDSPAAAALLHHLVAQAQPGRTERGRTTALRGLELLTQVEAHAQPMWAEAEVQEAVLLAAAPERGGLRAARRARQALRVLANFAAAPGVRERMWRCDTTRKLLLRHAAATPALVAELEHAAGAHKLTTDAVHEGRELALRTLANLAAEEANRKAMWADTPTRMALLGAAAATQPASIQDEARRALANLSADPFVRQSMGLAS